MFWLLKHVICFCFAVVVGAILAILGSKIDPIEILDVGSAFTRG